LEEAGVPVIPTIYVDHVDEATLENAAAHFGVADLVVKPQVSASSHNIMRVLVGSDDFIRLATKFLRFFFQFSKKFAKRQEVSILGICKGSANVLQITTKLLVKKLVSD
jgi:biotin carboxylase